MPHVSITLKGGQPKRQNFGIARFLTITDLGAAPSVDLGIEVAGFAQETVRNRGVGDRIAVREGFDSVLFTAPVDCTIQVFASIIDLRLNNTEGASISANIVGTVPVNVTGPNPLPVAATRGDAPGNPFYVSGQVLGDTPAGTVTDRAAVAASSVIAALLPADATRLEAVIYNQGPDDVAIGMVGLTWAKRAIVLSAGDCWIESRGAAKAWYVITDAAKAASVTVQERKA